MTIKLLYIVILFLVAVVIGDRILPDQRWERLHQTGELIEEERDFELAEELFLKAAGEIFGDSEKRILGWRIVPVGQSFRGLGNYYRFACEYEKAERNFHRAVNVLTIATEAVVPSGRKKLEGTLHDLVLLYMDQGKYDLAETTIRRAFVVSGNWGSVVEDEEFGSLLAAAHSGQWEPFAPCQGGANPS